MTSLDSVQREQLRQLTQKYDLVRLYPLLEEKSRPAIQIVTAEADDYSTTGNSRIGGVPDLPPEIEWQKMGSLHLVFVAQINFAELPVLPNHPFPKSGMLYFFHGATDQGAVDIDHRVVYYDGAMKSLRKADQPDLSTFADPPDWAAYEGFRVKFQSFISTPQYDSKEWREIIALYPDPSGDWVERYFDMQRELNAYSRRESDLSQILGFTFAGNRDRVEEAQLVREGKSARASLTSKERQVDLEEKKKWLLLLSLGSHLSPNMCWWDAGKLEFMIHADDLDARDFSRTYALIESG